MHAIATTQNWWIKQMSGHKTTALTHTLWLANDCRPDLHIITRTIVTQSTAAVLTVPVTDDKTQGEASDNCTVSDVRRQPNGTYNFEVQVKTQPDERTEFEYVIKLGPSAPPITSATYEVPAGVGKLEVVIFFPKGYGPERVIGALLEGEAPAVCKVTQVTDLKLHNDDGRFSTCYRIINPTVPLIGISW